MKNASMTVRLPEDTKARISKLAQATSRSNTFVVNEALEEYLNTHEWQVMETTKAVALADSDNATWSNHDTVKAKWVKLCDN